MERLKTLKVGSYIPAGTNPEEIVGKAKVLSYKAKSWQIPFGDGKSSNKLSK